MKALNAYVVKTNNWNAMFKGRQFDLNNADDRQALANRIDAALSPENLTCDGELSRAEVNARYKELTTVAKELQDLDPSVKFYEFG